MKYSFLLLTGINPLNEILDMRSDFDDFRNCQEHRNDSQRFRIP